jgi:hypothetical protein
MSSRVFALAMQAEETAGVKRGRAGVSGQTLPIRLLGIIVVAG